MDVRRKRQEDLERRMGFLDGIRSKRSENKGEGRGENEERGTRKDEERTSAGCGPRWEAKREE